MRSRRKSAERVVVLIEHIAHWAKHLKVVGNLVAGVEIHHPRGADFRVLVGFIADEPLTPGNDEVRTKLPGLGDLIFGAGLEAEGNAGQ
jgi:hypothetical protein